VSQRLFHHHFAETNNNRRRRRLRLVLSDQSELSPQLPVIDRVHSLSLNSQAERLFCDYVVKQLKRSRRKEPGKCLILEHAIIVAVLEGSGCERSISLRAEGVAKSKDRRARIFPLG